MSGILCALFLHVESCFTRFFFVFFPTNIEFFYNLAIIISSIKTFKLHSKPIINPFFYLSPHPQIVEQHLLRLGALHVEGCGKNEDHHMFSLEEVEEAVGRVRQLAADPQYSHVCILLTEKDYARQYDLWGSVFSRYAGEVLPNGNVPEPKDDSSSEGSSMEGSSKKPVQWGAYVLHSELQVVEHDRRFSSQKVVLGAMLRMSIDNFRRRSYVT